MKVSDVIFKMAESRDELEQAYELVGRRYRQKGYLPTDWSWPLWLTVYSMLPDTMTLLAKSGDEVIATVSLFPDSGLGFPLEKVFKEVSEEKRNQELLFLEIGMLSVDERISSKEDIFDSIAYLGIVMGLFKGIYDIGAYLWDKAGVEPAFFIAVVKSHIKFYEMLGFQRLSDDLKLYDRFNQVYAMCLFQRLGKIVETAYSRAFLRRFFRIKTNLSSVENRYILSWADVEYFLKKKTDLWNRLSQSERDYITWLYRVDKNA